MPHGGGGGGGKLEILRGEAGKFGREASPLLPHWIGIKSIIRTCVGDSVISKITRAQGLGLREKGEQ